MARYLLCILVVATGMCTSSAESSSPTCQAGDSQCTSGLLMLQKKSAQKKVVISETAADFDHGFEKESLAATSATTKNHGPSGSTAKESLAATSATTKNHGPSGSTDMVPLVWQLGKVALGKYPGYTGAVDIKGTVDMSVAKGVVSLSWSLTGTEDACDSTYQVGQRLSSKDKPNGCGLHIHKGTTCDKASEVGGHYYQEYAGYKGKFPLPLLQTADPWSAVAYGNENGASVGSTKVTIGKDMTELAGHAFVVHDSSGARVACGLVKDITPKSAAAAPGSVLVGLLSLLVMSHLAGW